MIQYDKIKRVRIELSTRCNSTCPDCPRNLRGVEILDDVAFPLTQLYLDDIKKIFPMDFLQQLNVFSIDGNFGDFITARDCLDIVQFVHDANPNVQIEISTNASARPDIWVPLGNLGKNIIVRFRLDGMKDTHYLYRQNTSWDMILENAQRFISAGGYAIWSMIVFDHNEHQIEECRALSHDLGFHKFELIQNSPGLRNRFPVFRKDRSFSHAIGKYTGTSDFNDIYSTYQEGARNPENQLSFVKDQKEISCKTMTVKNEWLGQEIFISADGNVFPCCWTAYYPGFKSQRYTNKQLLPIMKENSALVYGIRHAVTWFKDIAKTWQIPTVKEGRILICNETCGHDDPT